jgi:TonB-linked SusC/RagA family outer membrane protein
MYMKKREKIVSYRKNPVLYVLFCIISFTSYVNAKPEVFPAPATMIDQQQANPVHGTVTDENGEPVVGASVAIKGTTKGTVTDIDGHFQIAVSPGETLVVSYIGYLTREIKYTGQSVVAVSLSEDTQKLEEVIVVGYGTQKKINLTGAVANVNRELIESRPITSVSAGLQGLLSGVTVTQRSGQPGSDNGTIRVRGTGTFNKDADGNLMADPMVIVDGVESTMNDLDVNDIESISVLKDAASAAIYGSKAANGVILITTKRGKAGTSIVNYAANFGWQSATDIPEYVTSAEYARLTNQARVNNGLTALFTEEDIRKYESGSDPFNYPNTDWQKLLYTEPGFMHTHNLNISGGSEAMRYMASVGYQNQGGIIRHTDKDQYNMRLNLDGKPKKNLETSFSMAYTRIDLTEPTNPYVGGMAQIFRQANRISPWIPYKKEDGSYGTIGDGNPIAWLDNNSTTDRIRHNLQSIASLKYNILSQLSVKAIGAYKLYYQDSHEMRKALKFTDTWTQGTVDKLYEKGTLYDRLTGDILAEYADDFGSHHIAAMAGYHAEIYKYKYTYAYRENFPSNSLTDINAGGTANMSNEGYSRELAMLSWFGRINYDYAGKYLFEGNLRYDGTSRFAKGNRWGAFPSVSAGWRLSEEEIFESLRETVNNAKLRASWGRLGNQDIGQGYYPTITTLTLGKNYPFGGAIRSGAYTQYAANPNLMWEETTSSGIGLDVTLFGKLNVTLDYYTKTTDGVLMKVSTPMTYALADYYDNVGKVTNKGFEVSAEYRDRFGDVDFNFGANITFNRNRIGSLGTVREQISDGDGYVYILREGEPINSFFGYESAGLFQSQEEIDKWATYDFTSYTVRPGDIKYVDQNGDGKITSADRKVLGSWDPGVVFGFNAGASYKGWDIMAFFQGATDVKGYLGIEAIGAINGDASKPASLWLDSWTVDNKGARYPRVTETSNGVSMPNTCSDFWMQDATYLRLKNLQIGYTFPKALLSRTGISKLRLYYSGQNILTLTGFLDGWDPEAPSGRGNYYPQTQVHSFGMNITF